MLGIQAKLGFPSLLTKVIKMKSNRNEQFWLDGFEGKAAGGFFIRNDLVKTIERLESQGKKVVGFAFDGTWNLELIVQVPTEEEKN